MDELTNETETMVDRILNHHPLAPLPPHFVARVMSRVANMPQWRPEPFRLSWRDLLLPTITVVLSYLLFSLNLWLLGREVAWLPSSPALFSWSVDSLTSIGWLSIGLMVLTGEIGLLLLVGMGLWWDRPFLVVNEQ